MVLKAALEMGHSEEEAIEFFAGLDIDGNGVIDLDELTIAFNRMVPKVDSISPHQKLCELVSLFS